MFWRIKIRKDNSKYSTTRFETKISKKKVDNGQTENVWVFGCGSGRHVFEIKFKLLMKNNKIIFEQKSQIYCFMEKNGQNNFFFDFFWFMEVLFPAPINTLI